MSLNLLYISLKGSLFQTRQGSILNARWNRTKPPPVAAETDGRLEVDGVKDTELLHLN